MVFLVEAPLNARSSGSKIRSKDGNGDPGMTRTCDPWFRKPMLYPAELRGLWPSTLLARSPARPLPASRTFGFRKPALSSRATRPAALRATQAAFQGDKVGAATDDRAAPEVKSAIQIYGMHPNPDPFRRCRTYRHLLLPHWRRIAKFCF